METLHIRNFSTMNENLVDLGLQRWKFNFLILINIRKNKLIKNGLDTRVIFGRNGWKKKMWISWRIKNSTQKKKKTTTFISTSLYWLWIELCYCKMSWILWSKLRNNYAMRTHTQTMKFVHFIQPQFDAET